MQDVSFVLRGLHKDAKLFREKPTFMAPVGLQAQAFWAIQHPLDEPATAVAETMGLAMRPRLLNGFELVDPSSQRLLGLGEFKEAAI